MEHEQKINNEKISFYGLYVPKRRKVAPLIFSVKGEALAVLKGHKKGRLCQFDNAADALKFARTGKTPHLQSKHINESCAAGFVRERNLFRLPSEKQFLDFCKLIEVGNYIRVKTLIWQNPHYLVSDVRTPITLNNKYRYNAMHICSLSNQPNIAELILQTLGDVTFIELMTGKKMMQDHCSNLIDFYLNMPDRWCSETPIHIAAKFGHIKMVEVLASHPLCKMRRNYRGFLPNEIVCSLVPNHSTELRKQIEYLLEKRFYVPVLRSVGNVVPPKIGQPYQYNSPPKWDSDPLTPEFKIAAMAGPMNQAQAEQFCRLWKSPRHPCSSVPSYIAYNPCISPLKTHTNPSKAAESNLPYRPTFFSSTPKRKHAESDEGSTESTPSNIFKRLCMESPSPDTSSRFNLSEQSIFESPSFIKRQIKIMDTEKGLEVIGRELAREQKVGWREYWDFLDAFFDITLADGLNALEKYLTRRSMEQEMTEKSTPSSVVLKCVCEALENIKRSEKDRETDGGKDFKNECKGKLVVNDTDAAEAYTCVEKALQVHSTRIMKAMVRNVDSAVAIQHALQTEMRRLNSLIYRFKEDPRFVTVNYAKAHSRIGNLVATYLETLQEVKPSTKLRIQGTLKILLARKERSEHMDCICQRILNTMQDSMLQVLPASLQNEEMCESAWEKEEDCNCIRENNMNISQGTSRRIRKGMKLSSRLQTTSQKNKKTNLAMEKGGTGHKNFIDSAEDVIKGDASDEYYSANSSSDDLDQWYTPAQSPSELSQIISEESGEETYSVFINGNKPSKRDSDVLNALSDIDVDNEKYPHIYLWKAALLHYNENQIEDGETI